MTQPTGNPQQFLLMPATQGQGQSQTDNLQSSQFNMAMGQPNQAGPLTIIPVGSQPFQQYQFVSAGAHAQVPQFPQTAAYFIQQPGTSCGGADRPQYLVPQPVQVIQQPQYIFAPGQQLQPNQSMLLPAGAQQLLAMNAQTPFLQNQYQFVPSSTITYRHKPLSPTAGDLPGGMIWKIPSKLSPDIDSGVSGMVSPQFDAPPQPTSEGQGSEKVEKMEEGNQSDKAEEGCSDEEMVPISLKNKYENIHYNPDLELKYLTDDTKYTGFTAINSEASKRRRQLHEYLRDRPLRKIAPPTPMFAVYQLREQNWKRKFSKNEKEFGREDEEEGEKEEVGERRDSVQTERGFRTLSEMLGTMHDDTFTQIDQDEFKSCHHQAWKKAPKMVSMATTDSEDDYDDDVFEDERRGAQPTRRTRMQSFGFETPDRTGAKTTDPSPAEGGQSSDVSNDPTKEDSAFSDDSIDELSNDSDSRHGNNREEIRAINARIDQKPTERREFAPKRNNTVTIKTKDQMDRMPRKSSFGCAVSNAKSSQNEKSSQPMDTTSAVIVPVDASKIKFHKVPETKPSDQKRVISPTLPCNWKRRKCVSPKSSFRKPEGRRPLRRPRQPKRSRDSAASAAAAAATDWLARAAYLAGGAFRDRPLAQHKQKTRNA